MSSVKTKLAGFDFESLLMNASGVYCMNEDELKSLLLSNSGGIVFKTMTRDYRVGNSEPRFYANSTFSLQSMGLPNLGVKEYCKIVSRLKRIDDKPMFASISAGCSEDLEELIVILNDSEFDGVEVNLSCPNLVGKGIIAYDLDLSLEILNKLKKLSKTQIGVKLPPYVQRFEVEKMARGLVDIDIGYVSLINAYPLGTHIDVEHEELSIKPNSGVAGFGGTSVKPISIAQVFLFNQYAKGELDIIGVGGIETAEDVYEYILAGAKAVGIGTALWKSGPKLFDEIENGLKQMMSLKGLQDLSSKVGIIHPSI